MGREATAGAAAAVAGEVRARHPTQRAAGSAKRMPQQVSRRILVSSCCSIYRPRTHLEPPRLSSAAVEPPPPVSPTDNCKIETTPTLNQDAVAASQDLTHVWAAHWGDRTRKGPKQRTAAEEVGPRTRPPPPTSIPREAHCVKDATTIGCTSKRVVLC